MKIKRTILIASAAIVAALVLPASALAEYLVPEGNSAVNQYTEGFPTAGGEKGSNSGKEKEPVKPGKTIGANNAKKLQDMGPEGAAVAEVAAETAPPNVTVPNEPSGNQGTANKPGKQGSGSKDKPNTGGGTEEEAAGAPPAGNGSSGSGGSSGLGEVVSAATGSDSGHLGVLLPLAILAAIAWALAFAWRQRKRPATQ